MRVLQINTVCGIGSTGRIASDINKVLKESGHESYIAYGRGEPMNCDTAIPIGNKVDNYLHAINTRIFDKSGFGSTKATKDFINVIMDIDPDIIHLHNLHGYYIDIDILFDYLRNANKPIIWTLHDCWAFTGHCVHFDYIGCDKWKTACFSCPQKRRYPESVLYDNSKSNFNKKKELFTKIKNLTIVTPSKWLANIVNHSFLGDYPVEVINNGIDLTVFKPSENQFRQIHNLEDKFIVLGVASTWDERKGLKYFIELSNQLGENFKVVVVGLTNKQKKNLPNNILGITRTNNTEELAQIYTTADVFVNPTLEDNFPTTNLEAMACGLPVITFDTGGSPETIDNDTGFVIEKENTKQLINKIIYLNNNGNNKYKTAGMEKAASYFDKKNMYKSYLKLYTLSLQKKVE
ncbi:glycosyltransferase family 4 protein [Bacillus sp. MRMR6]|uniref:glycosyltransferase family 4 protein n=1 Tax=Bacillus sp. MRMR6 TaxID=1928617 RepID=UPI000953694D|nr:glycosyltransferase family 4 protein [Bacillus sp. MRMR6]OLS41097.1 glycosyl transferase [Bacillus sp. MRMR6]